MNEREFYDGIQTLEAAFSGRVPKDFEAARPIWFKELHWASKLAFNRAISDLIRNDRFPVLSQVLSSCNEHTPRNADGWLMNHDFCYRQIESEGMRCGCIVCHPEFWCKDPDCQIPIESRMQNIAVHGREKSLEFCYLHSDNVPDAGDPYQAEGR